MKRMVILGEIVTVAYCLALMWILFPQWHGLIAQGWRAGLYRWRLGRDQVRFAPMPLWVQEMAQVRGRFTPPTQAPRPFNLPL